MKRGLVAGFALLFLVIFALSWGSAAKPGNCPIQADTDVVIYGETGTGGVGTPSRSWMDHFFSWWNTQDASIKYVFLSKNNLKYDCVLSDYPGVKLYVQPGGNAYYQQNSLGSLGKGNILAYLDNGGAYFGACAGAYYASNDYYWQGEYYNWPDLLDRFPTVEGSITTIADYDSNPGYALTGVNAEGKSFDMIYYGGPTRGWQNTPSDFPGEQAATFTALSGNLPAAFLNGKMFLTSVHAEAYENDGITGLVTEQRVENYKWLAHELNRVMGTNFYVPPYAVPAQCSDGLDNDFDNFTDYPADIGCSGVYDEDEIDPLPAQCSDGLDNDFDNFTDYPADIGCSDVDDNDETDVTGPTTLFSDDFESGSLAVWTLFKASGANNWGIGTSNPYQGARYAEVKPQSTTEPASVMESLVSTVGHELIEVSYARRLVGIDSADEFKAKWFDGASWNVLEQTGSSSANDAAYVLKSYVLPSGAGNNPNFKLRFECTAGAVSEFCRVDSVNVVGN